MNCNHSNDRPLHTDVRVVLRCCYLSGRLLGGCNIHVFGFGSSERRPKPKLKTLKPRNRTSWEDGRREAGGSFQRKSKGPAASDVVLSFFLEGDVRLVDAAQFFFFSSKVSTFFCGGVGGD